MKPENSSSGRTSATTSSSAPASNPPTEKSTTNVSEADYLAQQADAAKDALSATLGQIKTRLGQSADVRLWTKEHPWISLATAAVAGFAAASTLVPSKEQQALKKLAAIEEALREPRREKASSNGEDKDGSSKSHGIVATILREAIAVLRPMLMSMLTAGLGAQQPPVQPEADAANIGPTPGEPAPNP